MAAAAYVVDGTHCAELVTGATRSVRHAHPRGETSTRAHRSSTSRRGTGTADRSAATTHYEDDHECRRPVTALRGKR